VYATLALKLLQLLFQGRNLHVLVPCTGHLLSTQGFPVQAAASSATAYGFDIHSLELIAYLDNAFIDIHATWKLDCFAGFANRIELINQCFEFSL